MNRSRMVALILLVAVIGLGVYIARHTRWTENDVEMPLKGAAALDPFYASELLVRRLGARAIKAEANDALPPASDAIILTNWRWTRLGGGSKRLEDWVERGGRLVVDGSLGNFGDLQEWAGIELEYPSADDESEDEDVEGAEADSEDSGAEAPSASPLPALFGSKQQQCRPRTHVGPVGRADEARAAWTLCSIDDARRLAVQRRIEWGLEDEQGLEVARFRIGRGSLTIVNGTPFTWREVVRGDHALLIVEALQLRRGDRVHFFAGGGEENLLELLWRRGAPVVVLALAALAFALWRVSARFGPPLAEAERARRSLGEQIRGTGQFLLRTGGAPVLHGAALRALDVVAEKRIRGYRRMNESERVEALAAATQLAASRIEAARDWNRAARLIDLAPAVACLESARRLLATQR